MFSLENGLQHRATHLRGLGECAGERGHCPAPPEKETKEPRLRIFHPEECNLTLVIPSSAYWFPQGRLEILQRKLIVIHFNF